MFPVVETRRRVDDYGEAIDPTSFIAGDLAAAAALAEGADEVMFQKVQFGLDAVLTTNVSYLPSKKRKKRLKRTSRQNTSLYPCQLKSAAELFLLTLKVVPMGNLSRTSYQLSRRVNW
jgi:hypothetical protein